MNPRISEVAKSVPFDNSLNGFSSINVQDAIEEAKAAAIAAVRFSIVTTFNGSVGNNQWLSYNNSIPGDSVPILIPLPCKLKEVAVSFDRTSVDGRIDFYKNGTNGGDIIDNTTYTFTNEDNIKLFSGGTLIFAAGDMLRGRWVDLGTNPNDMVIVYYFEVIE